MQTPQPALGTFTNPAKQLRFPTNESDSQRKMADSRSPQQRSKIMSSVGTKNTGPELFVRRLLHAEGYRFSLHRRDLPGAPDIVMRRYGKVIFVNGCFWHAHSCRYGRPPKSRGDYWLPKLAKNAERDKQNISKLRKSGWSVLVVWQCETKRPSSLRTKILRFMERENRRNVDRRRP